MPPIAHALQPPLSPKKSGQVPPQLAVCRTPPATPLLRKVCGLSMECVGSNALYTNPSAGMQLQAPPTIPQFYFPQPASEDALGLQAQQQVKGFLAAHPAGITLDQLKVLLKQVRTCALA